MKILPTVNYPSDIKKLNINELKQLSGEIRSFLLENISKTGGHLASNLGIVELTLALHFCFDFLTDKIVWDVGHQSYVHKILTGRKGLFATLRQHKGLSGFPKSNESAYDHFNTGHSSTSISAALGMALARDLKKEEHHVVSVIGDGSIASGLSFEALNNAGRSDTRLIVILNDNEMSISKNVGALSKYLNKLRTAPAYIDAKKSVSGILNSIPLLGKPVARAIEKGKNSFRYVLMDGALFDELGFTYVGPIDGHNIKELIGVLKKIKELDSPILLHVLTRKGKGYPPAEKKPEDFHGIGQFDVGTGKALTKKKISYSSVFGKKLQELAVKNGRIVAITAAMLDATGLNPFKLSFPNRIFDVGIAEAHAVTFAAGLAKSGFIPVVAIYSSFLQRAYDEILHDVCIQNLHVIFAIDRAGIVGADGETHQGVFDLSFLSHMPNMMVLAPKDGAELKKMLEFAVDFNAPVAIRYPRAEASPHTEEECEEIIPGKPQLLEQGEKIAVVSVGTMYENCREACDRLKDAGFSPALYNARFIKPIDDTFLQDLTNFEQVFIVEDNMITGGYGSYVLQGLSGLPQKPAVSLLGFPDEFIEQGSRRELFELHGLDGQSIYQFIISKAGCD